MTISMDDALVRLGGFGLFQWLVFLGTSVTEMAIAFQTFLQTFLTAEPNWACKNESTICNFTKSIGFRDDNYNARCDMPRSEWTFSDDFTSIVTEFDLVCNKSTLATLASMIIFAGWIFGSLIFGFLSDKFGRKIAFLSAAVNVSLVPLAGSFANSLWLFIVIRFFVGVGIGCKAALFVILSEFSGVKFSGVKHRGTVGMTYWISFTFAVMILPLFAYFIRDWRHLTILISCIGLPALLAWWICPESVRWSLVKKKVEKAENELKRIAKYNKKPLVCEELESPSEEQSSSFADLFATRQLTKCTLLSCFIWFVEAAVYYGIGFSSINLGVNMYLSFFIINSMDLPSIPIAIWAVNSPRIGRKWTTLLGMLLASITSFAAVIFEMFQEEENASDVFWVMKVIMYTSARLFIAVSFAGVWVWSNELFPTVIRNIGVGTTNGLARIGSFLSGYIIWLARVHVLIPYSIFSLLALLASVACFLLPETAGQPTQEIIIKDKGGKTQSESPWLTDTDVLMVEGQESKDTEL